MQHMPLFLYIPTKDSQYASRNTNVSFQRLIYQTSILDKVINLPNSNLYTAALANLFFKTYLNNHP
jgi:hypothetical protein